MEIENDVTPVEPTGNRYISDLVDRGIGVTAIMGIKPDQQIGKVPNNMTLILAHELKHMYDFD